MNNRLPEQYLRHVFGSGVCRREFVWICIFEFGGKGGGCVNVECIICCGVDNKLSIYLITNIIY
jgi:hypothetical protein